MDDISIKVLDALFDLCDGENYAILDEEDLTSRFSSHVFEPNELTEVFEALAADGLVDLKYADNGEYCVALRTKGRSLVKQSRDRLQKLIDLNPEVVQYREELQAAEADKRERVSLEEERDRILRSQEDKLAEARNNLDGASSPEEKAAGKEELRRVKEDIRMEKERLADLAERIREANEREQSRRVEIPEIARGQAQGNPEDKKFRADWKVLLSALIGGAVGAILIGIVFLIIFLAKFGG